MLKVEEEDGGHIKIKKINSNMNNYLMHIITNIDEQITNNEVDILISDLLSDDLITKQEAKFLKVATSDNVLNLPQNIKDRVRASIFKNMLLNCEYLDE